MNSSKTSRILSIFLCLLLSVQQTGLAQVASSVDLSAKFGALRQSFTPEARYRPLHLRYLSYDSINNNFKLLVDKGTLANPKTSELENVSKDLLKYFFIGLALPNDTFWVNLRPDSPDQIIDPLLEQTDIGRILLEADVELKKDTASATSPDTKEGKVYWDKLYQKAGELFGTTEVTIPTLTRPWIVPDEVIISESSDSAYIYKATLKVMLEEDYLKQQHSSLRAPQGRSNLKDGIASSLASLAPRNDTYDFKDDRAKQLNAYSTQLIKELILPKITQSINTGKKYASLRQVYYSLILASWFKAKYQGQSPSGTLPGLIDSKDLSNLTSEIPYSKDTYFKQYQKSFKEGEYKFQIPTPTPQGQVIRSYFSGGVSPIPSMPAEGTDIGKVIRSPRQDGKPIRGLINRNLLPLIAVFAIGAGVTLWQDKAAEVNDTAKPVPEQVGQRKSVTIREIYASAIRTIPFTSEEKKIFEEYRRSPEQLKKKNPKLFNKITSHIQDELDLRIKDVEVPATSAQQKAVDKVGKILRGFLSSNKLSYNEPRVVFLPAGVLGFELAGGTYPFYPSTIFISSTGFQGDLAATVLHEGLHRNVPGFDPDVFNNPYFGAFTGEGFSVFEEGMIELLTRDLAATNGVPASKEFLVSESSIVEQVIERLVANSKDLEPLTYDEARDLLVRSYLTGRTSEIARILDYVRPGDEGMEARMKPIGIRAPTDEDEDPSLRARQEEFSKLPTSSIYTGLMSGKKFRIVEADLGEYGAGAYRFGDTIVLNNAYGEKIQEEALSHEDREEYWMSRGFSARDAHIITWAEQAREGVTPYQEAQLQNPAVRQAVLQEEEAARKRHYVVIEQAIAKGANLTLAGVKDQERKFIERARRIEAQAEKQSEVGLAGDKDKKNGAQLGEDIRAAAQIDSLGSNAWMDYTDGRRLWQAWAPPEGSPWGLYCRKVLPLAGGNTQLRHDVAEIASEAGIRNLIRSGRTGPDTLVALDLGGQHSVAMAVELMKNGYQPVIVLSEDPVTIGNEELLKVLLYFAAEAEKLKKEGRFTKDSPPVFIFDAHRAMGKRLNIINLPEARKLKEYGITKAVYVTEADQDGEIRPGYQLDPGISPDMKAFIDGWKQEGIEMLYTGVGVDSKNTLVYESDELSAAPPAGKEEEAGLTGQRDRGGFGFSGGNLSEQKRQYFEQLSRSFAEYGLSKDEHWALVNALVRITQGSLRLRENELFTREDIAAILAYMSFDVKSFMRRFRGIEKSYQDSKNSKGRNNFTSTQIYGLLFRKLIPLSWIERLMDNDGLSLTDAIRVVVSYADPFEEWKIRKEVRNSIIEDSRDETGKPTISVSDATFAVLRWDDPRQEWKVRQEIRSQIIEDSKDESGKPTISLSDATRAVLKWKNPRQEWKVRQEIRSQIIEDSKDESGKPTIILSFATRAVLQWKTPRQEWKVRQEIRSQIIEDSKDESGKPTIYISEATRAVLQWKRPLEEWRIRKDSRRRIIDNSRDGSGRPAISLPVATIAVLKYTDPAAKLKAVYETAANLRGIPIKSEPDGGIIFYLFDYKTSVYADRLRSLGKSEDEVQNLLQPLIAYDREHEEEKNNKMGSQASARFVVEEGSFKYATQAVPFVKQVITKTSLLADAARNIFQDGVDFSKEVKLEYIFGKHKHMVKVTFSCISGEERSVVVYFDNTDVTGGMITKSSIALHEAAVLNAIKQMGSREAQEHALQLGSQLAEPFNNRYVYAAEFVDGQDYGIVRGALEAACGIQGVDGFLPGIGQGVTDKSTPEQIHKVKQRLIELGLFEAGAIDAMDAGELRAAARKLLIELDAEAIRTYFLLYRALNSGVTMQDLRPENLLLQKTGKGWVFRAVDYEEWRLQSDTPGHLLFQIEVFNEEQDGATSGSLITPGLVRGWYWSRIRDKKGFFDAVVSAFPSQEEGRQFLSSAYAELLKHGADSISQRAARALARYLSVDSSGGGLVYAPLLVPPSAGSNPSGTPDPVNQNVFMEDPIIAQEFPADAGVSFAVSQNMFSPSGAGLMFFDRVGGGIYRVEDGGRMTPALSDEFKSDTGRLVEDYISANPGRRVLAVLPNGNLGSNDWFVAIVGGKVYHYSADTLRGRSYDMLVVRRDGRIAPMTLRFVNSRGERGIFDEAGRDISADIAYGVYGQRIVKNGKVNVANLAGQFDDLRHLLRLPIFRQGKDEVILGVRDKVGEIYKDRGKVASALRGEPVELSLAPLRDLGLSDAEILKTYAQWGYRNASGKTADSLGPGEFIIDNNSITVVFLSGTHPHSFFGVTGSGRVLAGAVPGSTNFAGAGLDRLAEELIQKGAQDVFLWGNGKDVNVRLQDDQVVVQGAASKASCVVIISAEAGVPASVPGGIDSSTQEETEAKLSLAINPQQRETGGIDFRYMSIVSRAMANLSAGVPGISISRLKRVDLDKEWSDIEQLVSSGITPSGERIKEYLQASSAKGGLDNDIDKVLTCISEVFRLEEDKGISTDETLKDIMVVLEASRSPAEVAEVMVGAEIS